MICRRCKTEVSDGPFCLACGAKQEVQRAPKKRGNGQGCVYKRGSTWTAKIEQNVGGKRIVRTKGGFRTRKEALEYVPSLKGEKKPMAPTFAQLYGRWEPIYEPRIGKTTMRGHKAAYAWFKDIWQVRFDVLTADDLQKCVDACTAGKRTKENMKSLATLLYKYAGANKITEHNYAQYIYCGNDEKGTRPPFSTEEVEKICKAVEDGIPYADYVYCMIYTGFRPNEMLSLKAEAYDPAHGTLTGGFKTEAGRNRVVTLSPKIIPIIEAHVAKGGYLFPRKSGKMMDEKVFREDAFNPLMKALGIEGKVPYSCRHTFANLMKNVKGSDTDKAALIGHADASMTKYYQSPDYESLKRITDAL